MNKPEPASVKIPVDEVVKIMLARDTYSQYLGLQVEEVREGYCRLSMKVREDMLNGFHALHGGVTFGAADTAFAFACNSHGRISVGLTVTIDYLETGKVGDTLNIEAQEESLKNKIGVYMVRITNQNGVLIALFKGTSYRTSKEIA